MLLETGKGRNRCCVTNRLEATPGKNPAREVWAREEVGPLSQRQERMRKDTGMPFPHAQVSKNMDSHVHTHTRTHARTHRAIPTCKNFKRNNSIGISVV